MARKSREKVLRAVQAERVARGMRLICNKTFQDELNKLRDTYDNWALGPPMTQTRYHGTCEDDIWEESFDIERNKVNSPWDVDEREDPFIFAWDKFNYKWDIDLPQEALTKDLPHLSYFTLMEWKLPGRLMVKPSVVTIQDSFDARPNTLNPQIKRGCPDDLVIEQVTEALKRERASQQHPSVTRNRYDKILTQFQTFAMAATGILLEIIARIKDQPLQTVKSQLLAAVKWIGEKPGRGKAWKKWQVARCPICSKVGILSCQQCDVARCYIHQLSSAKKMVHPSTRRARSNQGLVPPRQGCSEMAAFPKWKAQYLQYRNTVRIK